jgi:hypothetical protein
MDRPEVIAPHPAMRTLLVPGDELWAVVLDQRTREERRLNSAAAAVWALLEGPRSLDDLVGDVVATLELDPAIAEPLVAAAVDVFAEQGLLATGETTAAEEPPDDAPRPLPREPDP